MTNHTADEFRTARFATHPTLGLATRDGGVNQDLWIDINGDECDDAGMALYGWYPVHEHDQTAEETIADLRAMVQMKDDTLDLHRETAKDYRRMIAERDDRIRGLMEAVVAARQDVSLDALRAAWEAAEQADECRKGDVLICLNALGGYLVYSATAARKLISARILSRAPQREPWADLADALRAEGIFLDDEDLEKYSQRLHESGVRVVTGGDDE